MDQLSNNLESSPPEHTMPPSPVTHTYLPGENLINRDFIIQCINKYKDIATQRQHEKQDLHASDSNTNNNVKDPDDPPPKRTKVHRVERTKEASKLIGILRRNSNPLRHSHYAPPDTVLQGDADEAWSAVTSQNNNMNFIAQEHRRVVLAFPIDLSRNNRYELCQKINENWAARYKPDFSTLLGHIEKKKASSLVRISPFHTTYHIGRVPLIDHCPLTSSMIQQYQNTSHKKRPREDTALDSSTVPSNNTLLTDMKANLQSRAERKVTRIATWNVNNGFDHLAIASIMAKNDIDILALQEPRISYATTDDIWISTMRKELRKCKYEMITSKYSYIIFDEQTSGAALAAIIRQNIKIQGRLLSVTFKSDDIWEVHTVISIYAVTNAKSGKKYANSQNSRKDVNAKLTKALEEEIHFLHETFGDAPITIVGDYQDTIHTDQRDNIGLIGKKMHPNGPLQLLIKLGFKSAFHSLNPNLQQVTRWNGSRTAGRHIDLQLLNESAASLLFCIKIDDRNATHHICSDHLIVIADYRIEKVKQDIIDSRRTKINFRKIAGIKMKLSKNTSRCLSTLADITRYNVDFDHDQFMSSMIQDQLKTLTKWQHEANSKDMLDTLSALEASMQALEQDTLSEDSLVNKYYDSKTSPVQRKLVERNAERRANLDSVYKTFQKALYQMAVSIKIVSTENKHVEALCTRQIMKIGKIKRYGENIINLTAPTSRFRSALGDLKHAEATLRHLQRYNGLLATNSTESKPELQKSFQSLAKNVISFKKLHDASCHMSQCQEEHIANERAVSIHRQLDAFSGIWDECHFSSNICVQLLSQTNTLLEINGVQQRLGVRHLDSSTNDADHWSDLDNWWNGPDLQTLASTPNIDINDPTITEAIQLALTRTRKIKKKAMAKLIQNKEKLLLHASRMNTTSTISKRLNPQIMDEPEAHHVILDPHNVHAKSNLRCGNFQQCLHNTLLYHQNWMDRSGSKWEHLWFKTTNKFGHISGITFNFTGKPSDAEFEHLVKQHQECSDTIKKAFQDAHSAEIASVMKPPQIPERALDWLWHPSSSDTDWRSFVDNYWKAISAIPGKARYNGYTMAIIGRLPRRWIDLHLRMMKMMMILRILPEKTKIQARVPIPKPKPGETRPLSLIHDDMCFILGFLTKHFALKCEEIKLFPPTLHAYRQGLSTSFITLVDLATREDAISFGRYLALTAEDEEKFFDRVSLEVQLAVLFILGFPIEGLLEMKAEEMDNISVEIHTRHGQVIGKFLHGLKQGSPFSCLISNLVLIFKHRVWCLRDPLSKSEDPNGYTMSTWNKAVDGENPPLVSMAGFCDDNSKWNMGDGRDFATLIQAIKWNIKLAGDLSMVFKIGRRGDKTIIELFNVDLQDLHLLPAQGFTSIAWDFKANRPTEEEVDCRVYLKSGLSLPITKPAHLSDTVWSMLIKGTSLKSERSLGIWRNQFGDTTESVEKRAFLFGSKIDRLNLSSLKSDKTVKIAVNSLVIPVYQFGILENKCCPEVYDQMDTVLINKVKKAMGFAWCDAKQLLFVPEEKFGMGIRSVSVEMLKSICREIEIQINDERLLGRILRGRLEAFKDASLRNAGNTSLVPYDNITQGVRNFIMEAIRHIARYGFFVRDMAHAYVNYQIEAAINLAQNGSLFKTFRHNTLGMHAFAGTGSRSGTTLGHGDNALLWSIIYGRCHTLLNGDATFSNVKMNFTPEQLRAIETKAMDTFHDDLQAMYTVFEWSDCNIEPFQPGLQSEIAQIAFINSSINMSRNWRRISALSCLKLAQNEDIITADDNEHFLAGLLQSGRNELLASIDAHYIHPNRLTLSDIELLLAKGWPLIVATDGGAGKFKSADSHITESNASASVVIFYPPNIPFDHYIGATEEEQAHMLQHNLLPWRARASSLPTKIGDHLIDNAHAECFAVTLMEEWLPLNVPALLIMDSEAERERYIQLLNTQHTTYRFLIRSLMSGVSKCLGSRLSLALSKHQVADDNPHLSTFSNIGRFCAHAKHWCYTRSGEQSHWKITQWQPGQNRTVWAIRSHQLESNFKISPKNRYGTNLVPNRTFVSANQWADNVCNAIIRFKRNAINSFTTSEIRKWCAPPVSLGITGPKFIITFNGVSLDRCVSAAVEEACSNEFIRRLAQRPTQGMLIRLQTTLYIKPSMIGRQSFHRRFLEGKTKTHTRAMYTDSQYRKASVYAYALHEGWANNKEEFQGALQKATKTYKYLRCPFCVPKLDTHTQHIFQHHASENSGLLGNSRHFCYHCLNENIMAVRQQMTQLLEDHLTHLFRLAANWGRNGFSTLLNRATDALTSLDRAGFHNAHTMSPCHTKTHQGSYACLSTDDWITFLESNGERVESFGKQLFHRWPLVHQLGFIAANGYTSLEMQDGEYSPCDMIPLGIIPLVLQDVISRFAIEMGNRHSLEAKRAFMVQWQQVRAAALLRAISIAMVTSAQISEHKKSLLAEAPTSLFPDKSDTNNVCDKTKVVDSHTPTKRNSARSNLNSLDSPVDRFPCEGITCSPLFTSKTTLRISLMRKKGDICRRCSSLLKAIEYSKAIESALAHNLQSFRSLFNHIAQLDKITIDDLIAALVKSDSLPGLVLPTYLRRATKRNVYPTVIMNTVRLLNGTFKWHLLGRPTSIDVVLNQASPMTSMQEDKILCGCTNERLFFATNNKDCCAYCGGISPFLSTESRLTLARLSLDERMQAANRGANNNAQRISKIARKNYRSGISEQTSPGTTNILRDITNLPSQTPLYLAARPNDEEIKNITRKNNMLSNFTITYFFKLLAHKFSNILYQEFLFDLVRSEGNWQQFVQHSRIIRHHTYFLDRLLDQNSICIVPICYQSHWTLLVRKYVGNSWKIFFIDSISNGSDRRFNDWKALFFDQDLFSGEWIKTKILPQSELECGARACLHGVCFALSKKKSAYIVNELSRFKDLAMRSRTMVSITCQNGFWTHQKWLSRIIGTEDIAND